MSEKDDILNAGLHPALDAASRRRGMFFLGAAAAFVGASMAIQIGLNENFVVGELGLTGLQRGVLDAFRETCGILAFAVLAILAGLAEPLVGLWMLLLLAFGISCYSAVPDFTWLIVASMVWSQGLHVWMPLPQSMAMALAEPGRSGHRLGQIRAATAVGFGVGLLIAWGMTVFGVKIRPLYLIAGVAAGIGGFMCLGIPRKIKTPGPRLVFRRRYALYYLLNFLSGWRKQIAMCFAGFLLVRKYGTPLEHMLLLWGAVQVITYAVSPAVGRLIDRIGERKVLVFYFAFLTVLFVGYAFVPNRDVLYVIFVTDNAAFVFAMSLTTYVNRIAPKSELTQTLSMGVAMNHVAAVAMPLVGGILWAAFDYRWPFLIGAFAAAVSIFAALKVPRHIPHEPTEPVPPTRYN